MNLSELYKESFDKVRLDRGCLEALHNLVSLATIVIQSDHPSLFLIADHIFYDRRKQGLLYFWEGLWIELRIIHVETWLEQQIYYIPEERKCILKQPY